MYREALNNIKLSESVGTKRLVKIFASRKEQQSCRKPTVREGFEMEQPAKQQEQKQGLALWQFLFLLYLIGAAYAFVSQYVDVFNVIYYLFVIWIISVIIVIVTEVGKFLYGAWDSYKAEIKYNHAKNQTRKFAQKETKVIDSRISRLEEELERTRYLLEKLEGEKSN